MSSPRFSEGLTQLVRQFMAGLRQHVKAMVEQEPAEVMAEKVFAAVAAAGAGLLLVLPKWRGKEGVITALIAAALRIWPKRALA
jgi:hypothetical protein